MKRNRRSDEPQPRYYCEHCHKYLAFTTYKKHKKYYCKSEDAQDADCLMVPSADNHAQAKG